MKKILIGGFLISTLAFANSSKYLEVKVGKEINSRYSLVGDVGSTFLGRSTENPGYKISLEGMFEITDKFDFGLGIAYQKQADRIPYELMNGLEYNSIPIYLVGKYKLKTDTEIIPYIKFNLGYSFIRNGVSYYNIEGGSDNISDFSRKNYGAIGAGLEYKGFVMELMYGRVSKRAASREIMSSTIYQDKVNYENLVLSVGYKFNL